MPDKTNNDKWFAIAGQEFGIVDGKAVAFTSTAATVMNEGGPFGLPRHVSTSMVVWMKMKRALIGRLADCMDAWIEAADKRLASDYTEEQSVRQELDDLVERVEIIEQKLEKESNAEKD